MTYIQPNANGSATSANSSPVVIASDQATVPVSLASVPSHAVTNAGTFAVQAAEADGANVTLGAKADAKSTATDTTAVTAMSVWKQISASIQAAAASLAGTLTVGTHAVTQSGTWTVQPGNTANTTAWKVDGSAVTQPVSLATNTPTLQSGSTTAVTQATGTNLHTVVDSGTITANADLTATGNITTQNLVPAGTATAGSAVSVTALSGMSTASVQVTGTYTGALSAQAMVDGSTWVTLGGTPFLNINTGVYSATIASGVVGIFQLDIAAFKQFRITGLAAMTGTAVVSIQTSNGAGMVALDAPLPTGTNVIGALSANQSTNIAQINGVTPLMGSGIMGTGSPRVTIASDNDALTVKQGTATNLKVEATIASAQTLATVSTVTNLSQLGGTAVAMNTGTRSAGTQRVTIATDDVVPASQSGTWTVQPGNTANTTPWLVQDTPATAGGLTYTTNSIKATATSLKASAGQVYGWYIYNSNTSAVYVQFFNTLVGSVTLGTTPPVYTLGIPAGAAANVMVPHGILHTTAIVIAATTTATGLTAPTNNVDINVFIK